MAVRCLSARLDAMKMLFIAMDLRSVSESPQIGDVVLFFVCFNSPKLHSLIPPVG